MTVDLPETNAPRIVIIGGGFAGITLAKKLRNQDVQVVMLDKHNYHAFQPLLYQVATAALEPDSIAYPLRKIFKGYPNFVFRMAEVMGISPDKNCIETSIGEIKYDYLVVATGSKTNFYGLKDLEANAMPMKSVPEALNLRSLMLQNFEKALLVSDLEERISLMNFVVVGGGPTGVEISGALAELRKNVLPADYPELDIRQMQIHLIEMLPKLLSSMSQESSHKASDFLKELGVNIWLNTGVQSYDGESVYLTNKKILRAKTLIWTAGVIGAVVSGINTNVIVRGNRIRVDSYNRIEGSQNIFAIGDVAAMISEVNPQGHPMVAPVAIQQAEQLARNIIKLIHGKKLESFVYKDKGSMTTIGRNKAVVDLLKLNFHGIFAWFVWLFVHILYLIGFRNKMIVLVNWMWNYFSYDRGIRLIIRPFKK